MRADSAWSLTRTRSLIIQRCSSHVAKAPDLVDQIHSHGMRAAVAISPHTPSSAISSSLGDKCDMLLVMTVVPGAGGQKFMKECVPKVKELRERFPEKDIQVDGGVGPGTVGCCARAGAFEAFFRVGCCVDEARQEERRLILDRCLRTRLERHRRRHRALWRVGPEASYRRLQAAGRPGQERLGDGQGARGLVRRRP